MPKWVWWLTCLGVLLESVKLAGFLADGPMELMLDAGEYWRLSDTVLTGDLFMYAEPIAYRTPVYPWFLSAIRLVAGQYGLLAVIVLQALLVVGTSVLAGVFARQISRRAVAMPITVTVMLFGVARVLFARAVLTETLFTFLLMLHLVSLAGYLRAPSPWRAIGGGLTFGILLLTRPVAMLLWVVHLVLFLWPLRSFRPGWEEDPEYPLEASERWTQRGVQLRDLVIAGAVGFLIATPWILRNRAMFERPVVTEFTGRNLWIVTFQDGAGAGLPLPETPEATDLKQRVLAIDPQADLVHNWSVSRGLTASGLSDVAVDQLMMKVARQAIDGGRIKFAERAGRRFVNFYRCAATDLPKSVGLVGDYQNQWVWHRPIPWCDWVEQRLASASVLANMVLISLVALAIVMLVLRRETRPWAIWAVGVLLYFGATTAMFEISNYRYRLVVEPLMAALVAAAIAIWTTGEDESADDRQTV